MRNELFGDGCTLADITADKEKVKPGTKGNLIVAIVLDRNGAAKPQANRRRTAVAVLPAIPFAVTGPDAESARNPSPATP